METIAFRMVLNPGMREEYERAARARSGRTRLMHCTTPACASTGIFFDPGTDHLSRCSRAPRVTRWMRFPRIPKSCANGGTAWPIMMHDRRGPHAASAAARIAVRRVRSAN